MLVHGMLDCCDLPAPPLQFGDEMFKEIRLSAVRSPGDKGDDIAVGSIHVVCIIRYALESQGKGEDEHG